MQAEYKILHFIANPIAGVRVPVAVLFRGEGGEIDVVPNPAPPSAACLGDHHAANAIRHTLPKLDRIQSFDRLPVQFGPQFVLSGAHAVQSTDVRAKLEAAVFPRLQSEHRDKKPRQQPRDEAGKRWLERRQLWGIVKPSYKPRGIEAIEPIAHFVRGHDSLLLMEPLIARKSASDDAKKVVTRLLAHASFMNHEAPPRLVAYFLPGHYHGLQERVREDLRGHGEVVDCGDPEQALAFTTAIRSMGEPELFAGG